MSMFLRQYSEKLSAVSELAVALVYDNAVPFAYMHRLVHRIIECASFERQTSCHSLIQRLASVVCLLLASVVGVLLASVVSTVFVFHNC